MAHHDLLSLKLFAATFELRSISEAARINGIAPSALSKRISDLEFRSGVPLFYRQRNGVSPTAAGETLYGHVKSLGVLLERLEGELSEYAQGMRGQVRLWANSSAVTQFLPEDLADYATRFPAVKIDLREETSSRIVDAVIDGDAEIGIFSDHVQATTPSSRVYRRDTLVVLTSRDHPLADRRSVRFEETLPFDHVGLQEGSSLQARQLHELGQRRGELRLRVQVYGFDGVRRMVEAGLGVAVLPQGAALPYLDATGLVALELDETWAKRSLRIGYREFGALSVVARALVERLAPQLRTD